tara:strand:- start:152 stop:856 length:705 start_codon:yes stop_codon:yes gene_type:complete
MSKLIILIVNFNSSNFLKQFYYFQFKYQIEINKSNIRINFKFNKSKNNLILNYNKKKIFTTKILDDNILKQLISIAKKYNTQSNKNKSTLRSMCGIPDGDTSTNHCFNDMTHQTCCLLGGEARKYSMKSGNPIGKLSEDIFKKYFNRKPTKNDLTPWCTCVGSKVCSYYASKFNDGTHIKFINSHNNNYLIYDFDTACEKNLLKNLGYPSHLTPGVGMNSNNKGLQCKYKKYYF